MHFLQFVIRPKRFTEFPKFPAAHLIILLFFTYCYGFLIADPISEMLGSFSHLVTFKSIDINRLIAAVIIAPLFEEVTARGFLTVRSKFYWTLPIFLIYGCITSYVFSIYFVLFVFSICFLGFVAFSIFIF